MSFEQVLGRLGEMQVTADALAAVTARLRATADGLSLDPAVAGALDRVAATLGIDLSDLSLEQAAVLANTARGYFQQAADLVEHPDRPLGWMHADPSMLRSQGQGSAALAAVFAMLAPTLDGLAEALDRPGATFLDVGSGIGALSVALCRRWPQVRVVGLEPWDVPMVLAEANVAASGFENRIDLRPIGIADLADEGAFDAAWLVTPFFPAEVVPVALARSLAALRPGGWVLFGLWAGPEGLLARECQRLRVLRWGGHPFEPEEAAAMIRQAGFDDVRALDRTWPAPVELVVGRRPTTA